MAHKPLVNGTIYEMEKGKPLVEGTIREIDHGKTLVGGTAYEVGFGPAMCKVIFLDEFNTDWAEINIPGYGSQFEVGTTYEIPVGTVIELWTGKRSGSDGGYSPGVFVNGSCVANAGYYDYTLAGDIDIYFVGSVRGYDSGQIYIIERSNGYIGFYFNSGNNNYPVVEDGMTWGEYAVANSGFSVGDDGYVRYTLWSSTYYVVDDSRNRVVSNDKIIARHRYYTEYA